MLFIFETTYKKFFNKTTLQSNLIKNPLNDIHRVIEHWLGKWAIFTYKVLHIEKSQKFYPEMK